MWVNFKLFLDIHIWFDYRLLISREQMNCKNTRFLLFLYSRRNFLNGLRLGRFTVICHFHCSFAVLHELYPSIFYSTQDAHKFRKHNFIFFPCECVREEKNMFMIFIDLLFLHFCRLIFMFIFFSLFTLLLWNLVV